MAKLIIRDAFPPELNGEYDITLENGFTKAEYFLMKKHVDVVVDQFRIGSPVDANVLTAWGLVMLRRAGKEHLFPAYMETTDAQTVWQFDEKEVGEDPAVPPVSEPAAGSAPNARSNISGSGTENGLGSSPETIRPLIGDQS